MTLNNTSQAQMRAHQRARAEAALDAFRDHAAYGLAPFIAWIAGAPRANRRKQLWLALSFEAARVMNATVIKGLGFTPSFVKRAHDAIAEAARADPAFAEARLKTVEEIRDAMDDSRRQARAEETAQRKARAGNKEAIGDRS